MNKNEELSLLDLFLGKKLQDFRRRAGWSQTILANKIGISHQQIHKYEQGHTTISTHMLYKCTQIFETPMNSFFDEFTPSSSDSLKAEKFLGYKKEEIHIFWIADNAVDDLYIPQALEKMALKINVYCLRTVEEVSHYLRKSWITSPFPKPDLILLDIRIQKGSGLMILKSLKQDPKTKDIPVIILTNSFDKSDVAQAYKYHASGYINKAFDGDVFQENLKVVIDYWTRVVILPDESAEAEVA